MELILDATTDYEILSFMDGYSRYNQMNGEPLSDCFEVASRIYFFWLINLVLELLS